MTSTSDSTPRSLVAHPAYGPLPGLLLILTVVTGVVDSISILALGRVFVANMTGNVVFAGFAIVGAPGFSLSASLFALAGFLVGAAAGGAVITRVGSDRAALLRAGTAAEVALAAVALVLAALSGDPGVSHGTTHIIAGAFGPAITDALAAVLATAMGIQNAVARKLAVPDLTTTVLTMTLTGIGADLRAVLRAGDDPRHGQVRPGPPPAGHRHNAGRRPGGRQPDALREPAIRPGAGAVPAGDDRRGRHGRGHPPGPVAHPASAAQVDRPRSARAPLLAVISVMKLLYRRSTASCCYQARGRLFPGAVTRARKCPENRTYRTDFGTFAP